MVEKGADVKKICGELSMQGYPLHSAVKGFEIIVGEYLLRAGADPNMGGPNGKLRLMKRGNGRLRAKLLIFY